MILSTQEIIEKIEEYKQKVKDFGYEPALTEEEVRDLTESIDNIPQKYKKEMEVFQSGDFSNFHSFPYYLRNYMGEVAVQEFKKKFENNFHVENEEVNEYLQQNAMNAVFRAGMSAGRENDKLKAKFDKYMSNYLLEKTLTPPTDEEKQRVKEELGDRAGEKALEENLAKQRFIAKTLFMAQLGSYVVNVSTARTEQYVDLISETVVHGGRTHVVLPFGGDQDEVMNAVFSENTAEKANVYGRIAATHSVKRRKVEENGIVVRESEETSPGLFGGYFSHQYGMDFASGGIGKIGPNKKTLLADGRAGHLYMRGEKGDEKHCGSFMFGFESCASMKTNFLGHTHTFLANSAKQTPFLTNKGGIGKNKNGRMVDLSGLTPEQFSTIMATFEQAYARMQTDTTTEGKELLAQFNKKLCGKRMTEHELKEFIEQIGIDKNVSGDVVFNARGGAAVFEGRNFNPRLITREKYENYFRARTSTEDACRIAVERFNSAGDCLTAVCAIKELQKIHNTRGFFWKMFHPILNHRENSTIDLLMHQLYAPDRAKYYWGSELEQAFQSDEDTYMKDYGIALNNKKGMFLLTQHKNAFKKEDENTEWDRELFERMGKEARRIAYDKRMAEGKAKFENGAVANPYQPTENEILAADESKKMINEDTRNVRDRAEQEYRKTMKEAYQMGLIKEDELPKEKESLLVEEDEIFQGENSQIEEENERESIFIEEERDLDENVTKSEFIEENIREKSKDLLSKN